MLLKDDPVHAFMPYPAVDVASAGQGPLAGLRLAVKDLFDVKGYRTSCGCPTKLAMSEVASVSAPAVQALLDAGAQFVGKTQTDELAWALYGMNSHFGTPINSAAPDRIPGGSSSGSAAAVAAGLADLGVGTDTGGSVRAPASFCGLYGFRPTHGRITLDGCMELGASFDTCGLFARDADTLAAGASVLLGPDDISLSESPRWLRPQDMVARLGSDQAAIYEEVFADLPAEPVTVYPAAGADALHEAFRVLQSCDCKRSVVPFIEASGMPLGPGLDDRVAFAQGLSEADEAAANAVREPFADAMDRLLGNDGVLLAPVVHDAPFRRDAGRDVFDGFRPAAMTLLCVAGMARLPQVVFPAGTVDGAPFGLSLIGPRGSDRSLIALAGQFAAAK
ncbi:amidase [Aurantimonas sp. VKM B-3413]|uniref:amidase n=1 Tax=Aurantimonas sp. VKM B-3413 TaxID=2779401 RepID=UPI001E47C9F7|nr:amidase [Aurantimonas sp. VKM B-3413]MCB8839339.1 amidase [Aurantimonas sp. VKM B-3413]